MVPLQISRPAAGAEEILLDNLFSDYTLTLIPKSIFEMSETGVLNFDF